MFFSWFRLWQLCNWTLHVVSAFQKAARLNVVFVAALEVRSREISMPGGRSHCSCEFWRQHCPRTRRMTNHNWQIFWLADSSCKFSFLVRTSFFFRGADVHSRKCKHLNRALAGRSRSTANVRGSFFFYKSEFIVYFLCGIIRFWIIIITICPC